MLVGIVGLGEVGSHLAEGLQEAAHCSVIVYQRAPERPEIQERARRARLTLVPELADLAAADVIISATQGTQSMAVAGGLAAHLRRRHCYADLSSSSPAIKLRVAELVAPSGASVVDGVLMASPLEYGHTVPIVVSGPGAARFERLMRPAGMRIEVIGEEVGQASAIKTLRHILMKGQTALLAECLVAARRYGVDRIVLESAAKWYDELPFMDHAARLMRTTVVHALRRAEEAEMAMELLDEVGVDPIMIGSAAEVLRRIAALDLRTRLAGSPPESLEEAIDLIAPYAAPTATATA